MNTSDARMLVSMLAEVGAISRPQAVQLRTKLNEVDAVEARRTMALDNDLDIWGVGGQG